MSDGWCVVDVEAEAWSRFSLAVAVSDKGDVEHFETLDGYRRHGARWKGNVWAHSGGTYDFLFYPRHELDEVLLTGARILRASYGAARLCDSYPLFQMSLAKLGKAVGLAKLVVDRGHIERLTRAEAFDYCERDCRVLREGIRSHRAFCEAVPHRHPSYPGTSGATAIYCAEAWEPQAVKHARRNPLGLDQFQRHSSAVVGGRCELWRLGEVPGPIYSYDVKSSYPSRYFEGPLPFGPYREVSHEVAGLQGVYWCRFSQDPRRLPLLSAEGIFCHEGQGYLTSEEIHAARAELGAHVEVCEGWVSATPIDFGRAFATELYRLKEAGAPFAKVAINSLHGKLGQRITGKVYRRDGAGGHVADEELSLPRWYQRPLAEAFILARARIALWRVMDVLHRQGFEVLYTDTDSCHTDAPPEPFGRVATLGSAPGQWELKATARRALYLAPKAYALELDDGEEAVALKGFPPECATWETLQRAWDETLTWDGLSGLHGFRQWLPEATARRLVRTLTAHPGAGKRRLAGDRVWYTA